MRSHRTLYDFDRSIDFERFGKFAWVQGLAPADTVNDERIVDAVSRALASKGFQPVVAQHPGPDLLVAYHTSLDRDVKVPVGGRYRVVDGK